MDTAMDAVAVLHFETVIDVIHTYVIICCPVIISRVSQRIFCRLINVTQCDQRAR